MHQVLIIVKCLFCKFLFFSCWISTWLDQVKISKTSRQSNTFTKTVTKTRVKKVYSLPGQKFDVPEEVLYQLFDLVLYDSFASRIMPQLVLTFLYFSASCWQREPLRIFYESLSKQIPSSEMAEFWLVSIILSMHRTVALLLRKYWSRISHAFCRYTVTVEMDVFLKLGFNASLQVVFSN